MKKFFSNLFSHHRIAEQGASLIQVLILVTIISAVSVFTMNQNSATSKKVNANLLNQDLHALVEKIQGVLYNHDNCTATLTYNPTFAGLDVGATITPTSFYFVDGNKFLTVTDSNQPVGDETSTTWYGYTKKISLDSITIARANTSNGTITFKFTLHDDVLGLREYSRSYDLILTGTATDVTSCSLNTSSSVADAVKRGCLGPGAIFDEVTNECHIIGLNPMECAKGQILKGLTFNPNTLMMDPVCGQTGFQTAMDTTPCASNLVPSGFDASGNITCRGLMKSDILNLIDSTQQNKVDADCRWKKVRLHVVNNKIRVDCAPGDPSRSPYFTYLGKAKGYHFCALDLNGYAYCWGKNTYGQLGNGTTVDSSKPVAVSGGLQFSKIATGGNHSCAMTAAGAVYCWGLNTYGQLGNGNNTNQLTPVAVTLPFTATNITLGLNHTCYNNASLLPYCWGHNAYGQLGNGTSTNANSPVLVLNSLVDFDTINAGGDSTCAVSGTVGYCWGRNDYGQLGDQTTINRLSAYLVSSGVTYSSIDIGEYHACGLRDTDGMVYCWGTNLSGQLGTGNLNSSYTPVSTGQVASDLAVANKQTLMLSKSSIYGIGLSWPIIDQCRTSTVVDFFDVATLMQYSTLGFKSVSTSQYSSCALGYEGHIYCWGYNRDGEMGDGSNIASYCPVQVAAP